MIAYHSENPRDSATRGVELALLSVNGFGHDITILWWWHRHQGRNEREWQRGNVFSCRPSAHPDRVFAFCLRLTSANNVRERAKGELVKHREERDWRTKRHTDAGSTVRKNREC